MLAVEQTIYVAGLRLTSATRLIDDLGFGRFDFLKLALYLEEVFGEEDCDIEIPDQALHRFGTIGDIVKYLSLRYLGDVEFAQLALAA
jgi:acyl carrier protein